jgi:methylated-DNA-protein-cysteine methyltransferase related protein
LIFFQKYTISKITFMNLNDKYYREKVYEIVRQIPAGRVMTYGQIAEMLSKNYTARTVGFVMHAAETHNVPWQRVINSRGSCSTEKILLPYNVQQKMLEEEGIIFNQKGICDLKTYRWSPENYDLEADEQPSLFD